MIKYGRLQQKRFPIWPVVCIAIIILAAGVAYAKRVQIRAMFASLTAPTLPVEEGYRPVPVENVPDRVVTSSAQEPTPTPPPPITELEKPKPVTPVVSETPTPGAALPAEKRLAVPFLVQAPKANWELPYQEACEEASVIMLAGYYKGDRGAYDADEADRLIREVVAFQESHYGMYKDTTAAETKRFLEAMHPTLEAEVVPLTGAEQVKRYIADGIPVIIPADGKQLPNPNFRSGGPVYHMLVVRGYTATKFITNDPGTRNGENFLYTYNGLLDAVHDWNGGDVKNGARVILIVRPRK